MASRKRDIGRETLEGIREIKRGEHGRVTTLPPAGSIREKTGPSQKRREMRSIPIERIVRSILIVRGHRVLLDVDLAELYGVKTKALLQAVKRNRERFADDFMLQLTPEEWANLRSQIVTSSSEHGGRRYAPYAFTEQGVAMLSSVLKSRRAIAVNMEIMRTFVRLREVLATNTQLAQKLSELERKVDSHDHSIADILQAIRELINPSPPPKRRGIGFTADID